MLPLRNLAGVRAGTVELGEQISRVRIATARASLEDRAINDAHIASPALDRAARDQLLDRVRDTRAADTQHQGDRVVGDFERVVDHSIVHAQEPPREPGGNRVSRVTTNANAATSQARRNISVDEVVQLLRAVTYGQKMRRADDERRGGDLRSAMKRVHFCIDERLDAAAALEADNSHLGGASIGPLFDFGDGARERKMDVTVTIAALRKRLLWSKRPGKRSLKTRSAKFRREGVQKQISRTVLRGQ